MRKILVKWQQCLRDKVELIFPEGFVNWLIQFMLEGQMLDLK